MTPKQERFIAEYRKDLNATQAAIRAGYSPKTANEQGARLLADASVSKVLAEKTKKALDKLELSAERTLSETASLAFSDLSAFYTETGDVKPMSEWTPAMRAAVQSLETLDRDITPGERGPAAKVHRLKLWDKPKALDTLAKHFGLLIEKVQHSGEIAFTWQR